MSKLRDYHYPEQYAHLVEREEVPRREGGLMPDQRTIPNWLIPFLVPVMAPVMLMAALVKLAFGGR